VVMMTDGRCARGERNHAREGNVEQTLRFFFHFCLSIRIFIPTAERPTHGTHLRKA
jgi:hypothetical protein